MIHRNLYISKLLPMNTKNEKKYFANALSKVARYSNDVYYRKCSGCDAVLERITVGFFDKFS